MPDDLAAGTFVRGTGTDLARGGGLAPAGTAVTPALLGTLASAGVTAVDLVRRLRVLVVSTGSELRGAGDATIGDANGIALRAALAQVGVETRAVRVPDDVPAFTGALDEAVGDWADLVLTTGGISAGAYEVVRQALEPRGLVVTPVAVQPGGPQASGTVELAGRDVPVVSFPGNPVSALVSFELFLRPLLAEDAGLPDDRPAQELPQPSRRPRRPPSTRSAAAGSRAAACTSWAARAPTCSRTTPRPRTSSTSRSAPPPSNPATP